MSTEFGVVRAHYLALVVVLAPSSPGNQLDKAFRRCSLWSSDSERLFSDAESGRELPAHSVKIWRDRSQKARVRVTSLRRQYIRSFSVGIGELGQTNIPDHACTFRSSCRQQLAVRGRFSVELHTAPLHLLQ